MDRVISRLRHGPPDDRPDADLLAAFRADRDEEAFAALVRRHRPLVWGVCRRLLPDPADAEDAFQAAFLVLVRRGYRPAASLAPWLHRVAYLTARGLRRRNARRLARRVPVPADLPTRPDPPPFEPDAQLLRMPAKLRTAVLLCAVERLSEREAADRLGCPVGTLSARLSRGLAWLRARAGAVVVLTGGAVPAGLEAATVRTAGIVRAAGAVPAAAELAAEVSRIMTLSQLRLGLWVLPVALLAGGAGVIALARPAAPALATRATPQPLTPTPTSHPDAPWEVGPPRPGDPAWMPDFRREYGLTDGQAVRFVPGNPFPPVRTEFLAASGTIRGEDRDTSLIVFGSNGRSISARQTYLAMFGWRDEWTPRGKERRFRGRRLWELLADGLHIGPPRLDADPELLATEVFADAVFRDNAPLAQVARSLQSEMTDKLRMPVVAATWTEEREVLVARGRYTHRPPSVHRNGLISVAATDLEQDEKTTYGHGTANPAGLFRALGDMLNRPVFDETDAKSWEHVLPPGEGRDKLHGMQMYLYERRAFADFRPADRSADRDTVLKHLTVQTGVTFTTEKRTVEILSLKKAGR